MILSSKRARLGDSRLHNILLITAHLQLPEDILKNLEFNLKCMKEATPLSKGARDFRVIFKTSIIRIKGVSEWGTNIKHIVNQRTFGCCRLWSSIVETTNSQLKLSTDIYNGTKINHLFMELFRVTKKNKPINLSRCRAERGSSNFASEKETASLNSF